MDWTAFWSGAAGSAPLLIAAIVAAVIALKKTKAETTVTVDRGAAETKVIVSKAEADIDHSNRTQIMEEYAALLASLRSQIADYKKDRVTLLAEWKKDHDDLNDRLEERTKSEHEYMVKFAESQAELRILKMRTTLEKEDAGESPHS